jgi:class 3 adenylate cyclase
MQAGPGEILVTSSTRDLTGDGSHEFEDRGAVELKGVPGPRVLFAVRA